jgi:hypothetical protein
MSNGDDPGIALGDSSGGNDPSSMMGGPPGGGAPDLSMSSDSPQMGEAPEEGQATIHFHKHSHTKTRHPNKPGQHVHHVHLKVHSIKFDHPKKSKVSKEDLAEALSSAGPPGGGDGGDDEPPPPPQQGP